jgi:hypothetical protein
MDSGACLECPQGIPGTRRNWDDCPIILVGVEDRSVKTMGGTVASFTRGG